MQKLPTCKIILKDEVNIKIEGLPIEVRRKIANKLKFNLPYARHTPAYKLGRWDGTKSFFGIGGTGYVGHLETIIPIIQNSGYEITVEDLREVRELSFPEIDDNFWALQGKCWPAGHPMEGQPIMLRDHQTNVVNMFLKNPQSLQEVATGAGKCLHPDTLVNIRVSGDSPAALALRNTQETLGSIAEFVKQHYSVDLEHNVEQDIRDLKIEVSTPSGWVAVNYIIRKSLQRALKVTLSNGYSFTGSSKHIVMSNSKPVLLDQVTIGQTIDHASENVTVVQIASAGVIDCLDFGLPPPHVYYCAGGVLHHNTIITATLSKLIEPYGRSVVIVPNKGLVIQTEADYINAGLDVGVYFGDRKELGKTHTICTWQSLNVLEKNRDDDEALTLAEFAEDVVAVIVDECHQAKADVLTKLLTQNFRNCAIRWGLTGTVPKEDYEFQGILASLGPVINRVSAHELQQKDVLSNLHINVLQTKDIETFKSYHDEYDFLVSNDNRVDWIARKIKEISETGNTLVLINRIETGNKLHALIEDSVFLSGKVKVTDRAEEYSAINEANNKIVIATYGIAAVGLNINRIFNLVMIEPGKSFVRVIQSIGRGVRRAADKDFVHIWDIASTCSFSAKHLNERKKFYRDAKYEFTVKKIDTITGAVVKR